MATKTKPTILSFDNVLDVLLQYREYAEDMRKHGRGFIPTDLHGCPVDGIISALVLSLHRQGWKPDNTNGQQELAARIAAFQASSDYGAS